MPIPANWLFAAVIFALVLVVIGATALVERMTRRTIGQEPDLPVRPTFEGTLPIFPDCRECLLAREAGVRHQARHLATFHGYLVFDAERAA
jgi:hypothetical protein